MYTHTYLSNKPKTKYNVYCYLLSGATNPRAILLPMLLRHQFLNSYYHVYHMPGPLEVFKGSLEFANGKFWIIINTRCS